MNKKHCEKCSYKSEEGQVVTGCAYCGCHSKICTSPTCPLYPHQDKEECDHEKVACPKMFKEEEELLKDYEFDGVWYKGQRHSDKKVKLHLIENLLSLSRQQERDHIRREVESLELLEND